MSAILTGICALSALCVRLYPGPLSSSPIVDLGYNLQQASFLNTQYDLYVFYDIRYAAAPTGANRFRGPQLPPTDRSTIHTGGEQRVCAQAAPKWQAVTTAVVGAYERGQRNFDARDYANGSVTTTPSARETEDCLFLDVYAPRTKLQNILGGGGGKRGLPVVVWIYGGGYVNGAKDLNPGGWFDRDRETGGEGIVFVSLNYRVGAFGWLAGQDVQRNGDANAGLLDQRAALMWVQKYITKFGGDPNNVTVIGESAGGGGVTHQITAYGGQKAPFCKAIIQSPGYKAVDEPSQSEDTYKNFLQYLGVSSLDEARNASFNAVYAANANQVGDSPYGQFTFWPVVDGSFVPDIPGKLLATGRFDSSVTVMVGHNAQEGIGFTSPFVQDDAAFRQDIGSWMPPAKASVANLDYISNTLYPQIFDGSRGYTNQLDRAAAAISELLFTCHTFNLDVGFHNATYSYFFATPPAYHGQDVGYTFFTGATNSSNPDERLATTMQMYFVNLARSGDPNGSGLQRFEQFGSNANMLVFNSSGIHTMRDDTANERCRWWQTHL